MGLWQMANLIFVNLHSQYKNYLRISLYHNGIILQSNIYIYIYIYIYIF